MRGSLALPLPCVAGEPPTILAGPLIRLTHAGLEAQRPNWALDGRRLLFARHEVDGAHVWQYVLDVGVSGKATPRRLTDRKEPEYNGAYSPDGTLVLFAAIALSGTQDWPPSGPTARRWSA